MFDKIGSWFGAITSLLQGDMGGFAAGIIGVNQDKLDTMQNAFSEFNKLIDGRTLVTTIMYPEITLDGNGTTYSELFSKIYTLIVCIAVSLIVLKTVYKGFQTYVLGDNDPSQDPIVLFKKMMQAFIIAIGFNSILYYILYSFVAVTVQGITTLIYGSFIEELIGQDGSIQIGGLFINILGNTAKWLVNPLNLIFLVIWIISFLVLYVKFIMRSVELLYLRIGFPIACVGVLDSDYGVFKPFVKKFFQAAVTIIIQIALLYLSLGIIAIPIFSKDASAGIITTIFACCFLWASFSVPKVLAEFLLWSGGGNGAASVINMGANVTRAIRTFVK
ncbi:Uncharacterised protein [Eubacterium limosum]|uniref:Uncharacterized protein n=1 Tax=Eubacterium limosum TaxID=1736 RepID=A0A6N3HBT9_EUBLI